MNHREKHIYSLVRSHKIKSRMGCSLLQISRHSNNGEFIRSSNGGCYKTTEHLQYLYRGVLYESHRKSYVFCKVEPKAFCQGIPKAFLHSGHQKTSYRCKVLPVKHSLLSHGYGVHCHNRSFRNSGLFATCKYNRSFDFNQKKTMRDLNERLSSYLEKVRSLKQENERFEKKIAKLHKSNASRKPSDHSRYSKTIKELQNQISTVLTNNVGIIRNIDNTRMAIKDYSNKYEVELSLRSSIDADVVGLHDILEWFNDQTVKLESEVDILQQEMIKTRRESEQEVNSLSSQRGTTVNVKVETSPSVDLNKVLSRIREEYEKIKERTLRELEKLFPQRSEKMNQEMSSGSDQLQSANTELIDVNHSLLTMEIELQSVQNMISALKDTLEEKKAYYISELAQLQGMINSVESKLDQIRTELEIQNEDHQLLMDRKTHLEQEITTYQFLLDAHGIHATGHPFSRKQIEQSPNNEQKDKEDPED